VKRTSSLLILARRD